MVMKISDAGLQLIKSFEAFRAEPYLDTSNPPKPTIGYGTTIRPDSIRVSMQDRPITEAEALEYLKYHVNIDCSVINSAIKVQTNQNQFDALCSLVYNIGWPRFKTSHVLNELNKGNYELAAEHFLDWKFSGGKPVLLGRRTREKELFLKPIA